MTTPEEFLAGVPRMRAEARAQGSAAKWAHSAMALASRVIGEAPRPVRSRPTRAPC